MTPPVSRGLRSLQTTSVVVAVTAIVLAPLLGLSPLHQTFDVDPLLALPLCAIYAFGVFIVHMLFRRWDRRQFHANEIKPPSPAALETAPVGMLPHFTAPRISPLSPRNPRQMRQGVYIALFGFGGALFCAVLLGMFPRMNADHVDTIRRVCLGTFFLGLLLIIEGGIRWQQRGRRLAEILSAAMLPRNPVERKWVHGYLLLFPFLTGFLLWSFVLETMTLGYLAITGTSLYCLIRGPHSLRSFFGPALAVSVIWPVANFILLSVELPPLTYGRGLLTTAGWIVILFEFAAPICIPAAGLFGRPCIDTFLAERRV